MGFFHLCCRAGGNNLNAGSLYGDTTEPGTSPDFSYSSVTWDGASTLTLAGADFSLDGVQVGMLLALNTGGGATIPVILGYVTAVGTTTLTIDAQFDVKSAGAGAGTYDLRIGGAWEGPVNSDLWPFGLATHPDYLTDYVGANSGYPLVHIKNDQTFSPPNGLDADLFMYRAYSDDYGQWAWGGHYVIIYDTNTVSSSILLNGNSGNSCANIQGFDLRENGGNCTIGYSNTGAYVQNVENCRSSGFSTGFRGGQCIECEAYNNTYGFTGRSTFQSAYTRCFSHSNTNGFYFHNAGSTQLLVDCVIAFNSSQGYRSGQGGGFVTNCDFYNNGYAIYSFYATRVMFENCNFAKQTLYVCYQHVSGALHAFKNCGFGGGAFANASDSNGTGVIENVGRIDYTTHPWQDPDNGDFTIIDSSAVNAGRWNMEQYFNSMAGTTGYNSIGAANLQAGGGGVYNPFMTQRVRG